MGDFVLALAAKKIDVDELSHCATAKTSVANQDT